MKVGRPKISYPNDWLLPTYQDRYVRPGKLRAVSQVPEEQPTEAILVANDLINVPHEGRVRGAVGHDVSGADARRAKATAMMPKLERRMTA